MHKRYGHFFVQLMRYIISQVTILWKLCTNKNTTEVPDPAIPGDDPFHTWRPWEHIYSLCKVAKHHIPLFNPLGKYIVKLYWMVSEFIFIGTCHHLMKKFFLIYIKHVNTWKF